jgi:hypothetical protein
MSQIGKSAEYNPKFSVGEDGIAYCPKCNNELSESNAKTAQRLYCTKCEHWIITRPSHHEGRLLGSDHVLFFIGQYLEKKSIEYPGGYIKPYCPICKKPMWVEKMWWDKSEVSIKKNKCRLVLGYVCEDWENCGYTQSLKFLVPLRSFDYIKEIKNK